jgi:hypothetical protein
MNQQLIIELARKHGADDAGAFCGGTQVIAVTDIEALFAELILQANKQDTERLKHLWDEERGELPIEEIRARIDEAMEE